jgi:ABC-2 type transport system ATP-binding protein
MIEVSELTKSFGTVTALDGVSFSIQPGEIVGLLGPNGAGKSTAMRIVTGYLSPTSGSAKVNGREVVEDPRAAQRLIGYLPEGNPLYDELRLGEALRFHASMRGLRGEERARAIASSIAAAGLEGFQRRLVSTLSRGYKQRVGLAQALLGDPRILILDEPSSGLDPNQQVDMRALLRRLGEERTVIFSSHILPEVEAACDRLVVMHKGRVVADGPVEEVRGAAGIPYEIRVRVRGNAVEGLVPALEALPFATAAAAAPRDGGWEVRVETDSEPDLDQVDAARSAAAGLGLDVSEAYALAPSLERVFARLTGREDVALGTAAGMREGVVR